MAGSAFLLLAVVCLHLWFQTSEQLGHASFDIRQVEQLSLATTTQRWLFMAFFIAFAVKVPIFPLHTWLPDAHTEAPTNGSIVLAALLLKAGPYGLLGSTSTCSPRRLATSPTRSASWPWSGSCTERSSR